MKLLTLARDLRRRKARERQGLFVCEGIRTVEELLRSAVEPVGAVIGPQLASTPRGTELRAALDGTGIASVDVGESELASAAETESPQGVLLIARVPQRTLDAVTPRDGLRLVVLDAVQDPGNVGTIVRTAAALGAAATVALPGTADLWNAKVVRSAMGAHFHHAALAAGWDELEGFRRRHGVALWAADAAGDDVAGIRAPERLALVVGNEGSGLSDAARQRAERLVALPIAPTVESLNVAVATGIFLYLLRR